MKTEIKGVIIESGEKWIYDYFGEEATSPAEISKSIAEAESKGEALEIFVSSPGGSLTAGVEMYTMLRAYGNVKFTVAQAASAASVVICAGKSEISPVGTVMIHNVSCGASGDYNIMEKVARILKQLNKTVAAAYAEKTGLSESELLMKMNAETWLTAKEAVELGICDSIQSEGAVQAISTAICKPAAAVRMIPDSVINKFKSKRAQVFAELDLLKLRR